MNEKLLELLDAINEKKTLVQNLAEEGKLDEAEKAKTELKNMQKKFDILKDVLDSAKESMEGQVNSGAKVPAGMTAVEPEKEEPKDSTKEFANAARKRFMNQMSEGSNPDGGFTIPDDIQTRINEYRDAQASLIDEVAVERVTTPEGSRTYKKRAQQTGFAEVGEGGKITGKETPQFERLSYKIKKYAGYFPVTNELLADSDQNITGTLITWIGNESRVTRNKLILEAIEKKEKEELKGLDDIKKALNVTLGQAFKATSKIITNDDGLQYLDTLKDVNGRDMLQPNPTDPAKMQLRAGATIVPIKVLPNNEFASDVAAKGSRKIPMIIGDLREAVRFFDRNQMSLTTSNIAAVGDLNAFEEDLTIFRAIERECVETVDLDAIVYGQIVLEDATVAGE